MTRNESTTPQQRARRRADMWLWAAVKGLFPETVALREAHRLLRSTARTPSLMAELLEGDVD